MTKPRTTEEIKKDIAKYDAIDREIQATRDEYGNYRCKEDDERHCKVFTALYCLKRELKEAELYEA